MGLISRHHTPTYTYCTCMDNGCTLTPVSSVPVPVPFPSRISIPVLSCVPCSCSYPSPHLVSYHDVPIPVLFPILHPMPPVPSCILHPSLHPMSHSPFPSLSPSHSLSHLSVVLVACMSCPNLVPHCLHCSLLPSLSLVVFLCSHLINDNIHLYKMCEVSDQSV